MEEQRQPEHDIAVVEGATATDLLPALVQTLVNERARHGHVFEGMSDEEDAAESARSRPPLLRYSQRKRNRRCRDSPYAGRPAGAWPIPAEVIPRLTISAAMFPGISRDEVFSTGRQLVRTAVFVRPFPPWSAMRSKR